MTQQVARAEARPADGMSAGRPEELGRDWLILRDCRLRPSERGVLPTVLIHPARGVAVLDILPSDTPGAEEAVRARLASARFSAIFAGHLPVVHLQVTARQMPFLPALLDDALAAEPPLSLPGGDAWVGVAARALTAAEQPAPRPEPRRARGGAVRRPRRRGRAVLRTAAAVLLCVTALGGLLAVVTGGAPEPGPAVAAALAPDAIGDAEPREALLSVPPPEPLNALPAVSEPFPPARGEAEAAAPPPEAPFVPAPLPAVAAPPPPQRAVPEPAARKAPDRPAPRRQQEARAVSPPAAPAPSPEPATERCRRITVMVGAGASLGDGDMRFFNEACIRW